MLDNFVLDWYLLILSSFSIEKLSANSNSFKGSLPEQISRMSNLKEMWLGNNSITGQIPESIGYMNSLGEWLEMHRLFLELVLISYAFRNIETLSLWGNSMRGTIPNSLYYLTNLKALHLRHNSPGFWGTLSSDVGKLVNLRELVLNNNPLLTGTVPSELGLCRDLSKCLLHFNVVFACAHV